MDERDEDREESQDMQNQNDTFQGREDPNSNGVDEDCDKYHSVQYQSSVPPLIVVRRIVQHQKALYDCATKKTSRRAPGLPPENGNPSYDQDVSAWEF